MPWVSKGSLKGPKGDPGTTTWGGITDKPAVIAAGADAVEARNAISAVEARNDAKGLWIGTAATLPGTGAIGVLYVTY